MIWEGLGWLAVCWLAPDAFFYFFLSALGSSWNLFGGCFASFFCYWSPILPMGFRGVVFSVLGMEIMPGPSA